MKLAAGFVIFRSIEKNLPIEYLLLKTSYGNYHWTPPKGHVDPGESTWLTALRETEEEAGLAETDLHIYKNITKTLHYNVNGIPKDVVYWVAKLKNWEKNIKLSEEHTEYKWLSLADAKVYSTYEDFNNMLDEFDSKIKEEMQ